MRLDGGGNPNMYTERNEAPTHEQIERRAYQIYLEHGFHTGNSLADWFAAEKELVKPSESGDTSRPSANSMAGQWRHATA
jgi:hypothetical protein